MITNDNKRINHFKKVVSYYKQQLKIINQQDKQCKIAERFGIRVVTADNAAGIITVENWRRKISEYRNRFHTDMEKAIEDIELLHITTAKRFSHSILLREAKSLYNKNEAILNPQQKISCYQKIKKRLKSCKKRSAAATTEQVINRVDPIILLMKGVSSIFSKISRCLSPKKDDRTIYDIKLNPDGKGHNSILYTNGWKKLMKAHNQRRADEKARAQQSNDADIKPQEQHTPS